MIKFTLRMIKYLFSPSVINEAVSLSGSIGSQKAPIKREVELEEETTRKFSKSCDEARIPETIAMTFNQCTFIISKD